MPASFFFFFFFNLRKQKKEAWPSWMTEEGAEVMLSASALPRELQQRPVQPRAVPGKGRLRSCAPPACYSSEILYPEGEP